MGISMDALHKIKGKTTVWCNNPLLNDIKEIEISLLKGPMCVYAYCSVSHSC